MTVYFEKNDKNLCCGCRGCEQICPNNCITMKQDQEGFIYPIIDRENCINCGLCEKVCPIRDDGYNNINAFNEPIVYAAYHKDEGIVEKSTSGGAFTSIVQAFCDEDYVIFGASFDENLVVQHTFVTDKSDINKFRGSKYIQSDMGDCFEKARKFLNEGKKVLFTGTPCQIAGLNTFLGKDYNNLLCVDMVCHGVPSPKVFELYKKHLSQKYKQAVKSIDFRDKSKKNWTFPYMTISFKGGKKVQGTHSDNDFITGFYKSYYIRPVCHSCHFTKIPRVSDITIADFWGIEDIKPKFYNKKGTSLILINTESGINVSNNMTQYLIWEIANINDAIKYNPQLNRPADLNAMRSYFMSDLKSGMEFSILRKKYLKRRPLLKRVISRVLNRNSKNKIKKILRIK